MNNNRNHNRSKKNNRNNTGPVQAGRQPTKGLDIQEGNKKRSVKANGKYRAGAGAGLPLLSLYITKGIKQIEYFYLQS